MSNTVEQYSRYRKFCKIVGLHNVFNDPIDNFYNTTELNGTKTNEFSSKLPNPELPITKNTILFIIADSVDKNKKIKISTDKVNENGIKIDTIRTLSKGNKIEISTDKVDGNTRILSELDTMLWVNGNIYSLSQKNVKTVFYNDITKQLDIVYSNDDKESIDVTDLQVSKKIAVKFPLSISEENSTGDNENEEKFDYIRLFGQDINDSGRNFVIGMYKDEKDTPTEYNNKCNNLNYTTIIGKGNIASKDGQIILGDFNESTDSKFIVCNGDSNERKNIFTISDDGRVFAKDDFVLPSKESTKITYRLSDIHDVIDEDWYKES